MALLQLLWEQRALQRQLLLEPTTKKPWPKTFSSRSEVDRPQQWLQGRLG
jgi:hypothetical protein